MCGVCKLDFIADREASPTPKEVDMFARKVAARLKPNSLAKFTKLMECEILPWLRKQEGFLELITLATPDRREVATISFWEQGNAQTYNSSGYPEALKVLVEVLDGPPYVKTFDVVSSTFQSLDQAQSPAPDDLVQERSSAQSGYRSYGTSV